MQCSTVALALPAASDGKHAHCCNFNDCRRQHVEPDSTYRITVGNEDKWMITFLFFVGVM